ncbi:class I SAM-dependent methyltransferase [Microbacterium sp. NPDC056003]|uniref:class I SAM-dependent methyltransferase n=1 Tax=Microbacterium sp. NPDC056003 TaxID=3345676 RepID=UPI0035E03F87
MSRLSPRDLVAIAVFLVGGAVIVVLALVGQIAWAIAALGVLAALAGIITRVEFASRRRSLQRQEKLDRTTLRASEQALAATREIAAELAGARREIAEVGAQVVSATTNLDATRAELMDAAVATRAEVKAATKAAEAAHARVNTIPGQHRRLASDLVTDVQALFQLMQRYSPSAPLPLVAGWALSPAGLLYLADSIERRQAELVVECGSGTSTLWAAMAMRHKGSGRVLALEHLDAYAEKTRAVLEAHGLSEWAEVRVCPLVDVSTPRGEFRWYDFDVESLGRSIDILLVDGPPGTTGPHARYPALPLLAPKLSEPSLIVVDDAERPDERETIGFWTEEWAGLTVTGSPGRGVVVLESRSLSGGPAV